MLGQIKVGPGLDGIMYDDADDRIIYNSTNGALTYDSHNGTDFAVWRRFLFQASLNSVIPFTLIAWAEQSLDAGVIDRSFLVLEDWATGVTFDV